MHMVRAGKCEFAVKFIRETLTFSNDGKFDPRKNNRPNIISAEIAWVWKTYIFY